MGRDKKTRAGMLRFVVLDGSGQARPAGGPGPGLLAAAYSVIAGPGKRTAVVDLG